MVTWRRSPRVTTGSPCPFHVSHRRRRTVGALSSRSSTFTTPSAPSTHCAGSRCRWRAARSMPCSGRTARARRPSSACCPGSWNPRLGSARIAGIDSAGHTTALSASSGSSRRAIGRSICASQGSRTSPSSDGCTASPDAKPFAARGRGGRRRRALGGGNEACVLVLARDAEAALGGARLAVGPPRAPRGRSHTRPRPRGVAARPWTRA